MAEKNWRKKQNDCQPKNHKSEQGPSFNPLNIQEVWAIEIGCLTQSLSTKLACQILDYGLTEILY